MDNVPFQSEFQEPNPPCLRVQSPSKGRKRVGDISIILDLKFKFSKGPQQPEVDFQLGWGDEGHGRDGSTDVELRLGDVFRGIKRRGSGLCR